MYRTGHLGIAMLGSLPLVAALSGSGRPELGLLAGATVMALSTLPDVDHVVPGLAHRGPTHSLLFAVSVGCVIAVGGWMIAPGLTLGPQALVASVGFLAGSLAVLTHLLGDLITPMGVNVYWPLGGERRSLNLVAAKNPLANQILFVLGLLGWAGLTGAFPELNPTIVALGRL